MQVCGVCVQVCVFVYMQVCVYLNLFLIGLRTSETIKEIKNYTANI